MGAFESKTNLQSLIQHAVAHVEKGDKATAKAEEHYKAAGIYIAQCKERYKQENNLTWVEFCKQYYGFTARRADELIMIGDGRTTLEKVRANAAVAERVTLASIAFVCEAGTSEGGA
jgi:hypothetical protein